MRREERIKKENRGPLIDHVHQIMLIIIEIEREVRKSVVRGRLQEDDLQCFVAGVCGRHPFGENRFDLYINKDVTRRD